jgi:hypothetical protein
VEGSWAKKAAALVRREAWKDPASVFNFVPPPGSEELLKAAGSTTPGVTNLEVAVNAEGGSQVFSHVAGADPFNEASAFCAKHVSAVRVGRHKHLARFCFCLPLYIFLAFCCFLRRT